MPLGPSWVATPIRGQPAPPRGRSRERAQPPRAASPRRCQNPNFIPENSMPLTYPIRTRQGAQLTCRPAPARRGTRSAGPSRGCSQPRAWPQPPPPPPTSNCPQQATEPSLLRLLAPLQQRRPTRSAGRAGSVGTGTATGRPRRAAWSPAAAKAPHAHGARSGQSVLREESETRP